MGQGDDRLIDMAAKQAMRSPILEQPPQQGIAIDIVQLCNAGVLKPKQVFDYLKKAAGDGFPFEWQEDEPLPKNATMTNGFTMDAAEAAMMLHFINKQMKTMEVEPSEGLLNLQADLTSYIASTGEKF